MPALGAPGGPNGLTVLSLSTLSGFDLLTALSIISKGSRPNGSLSEEGELPLMGLTNKCLCDKIPPRKFPGGTCGQNRVVSKFRTFWLRLGSSSETTYLLLRFSRRTFNQAPPQRAYCPQIPHRNFLLCKVRGVDEISSLHHSSKFHTEPL